MLGLAPISAVSISGGQFKLALIALAVSASGSAISLGGTGLLGNYIFRSASGPFLTFGGQAAPLVTVFRSATGAFLTFGGAGILRLTGKPEKFAAMIESYTFVAQPENFTLTAIADNYTFRGVA